MVTAMRLSAICCALATAMTLSGGEALAHAQLLKADPRVGSTVKAAPARMWMKFSEVPRLMGTGVQLIGSKGPPILLQPLTADPKDVRAFFAPLPANLAPGRYQVRWRALSPDAHHTQGDFSFTVRP